MALLSASGTDTDSEADFDPAVALLKARELELLRAKIALIKSNGLAYYRPHEKQHLFHSSVEKRRGFFAGNRTGKSECDAAETVAWFLGERSWYKHVFPIYGVRDGKKTIIEMHEGHENHPLVRAGIPRHATKQLIVTTDWKKVDEVWTSVLGDPPGKIWKFIPKTWNGADLRVETRSNQGIIDRIYNPDTGAIIRFTNEQAFIKNPQSAESVDLDRLAFDEPAKEDMYKALSRGLIDRGGTCDFTLTSLRERWIYDYFSPEDPADAKEGRFHVRATMHDNPYLKDEDKQRFIDDLTDDERMCRIEGLPLELSGLVYKEFRRETHVLKQLPTGWTAWNNPPPDHTIYVSIDVHTQTPQAAMFVAVGPTGRPIVYDEIWRKCNADELAQEVLLRITGRTVGFIKADPRAWEEDPVYHVSMAQRFFAAGLFAEKASKAKDFGITNMQSVLKREQVHFAPSTALRRTLWEISRYCYDKENKPVDADDHFMECMYRIFILAPLSCNDPATNVSVPDFQLEMSSRVLRDFDRDMAAFEQALLN